MGYNFRQARNPVERRVDHLALAMQNIGDKLVTDAMLGKRQASMDKKQDARTALANKRTDDRNLILDERADKALELQAGNRSEDIAYRNAESARTTQYRSDTMEQTDKNNLLDRAGKARDSALATTTATNKLQREQNQNLLKSYQTELDTLIEASGGEFGGKVSDEDKLRITDLRTKIDMLRGEQPKEAPPKALTPEEMAELKNAIKERAAAANKPIPPVEPKTATGQANLLNDTNEQSVTRVEQARQAEKDTRAKTSADYAASKDADKQGRADKGKLERYLNTGALLKAARQKGKDVVIAELEEMWETATATNKKLIEAQLATLMNVRDIK